MEKYVNLIGNDWKLKTCQNCHDFSLKISQLKMHYSSIALNLYNLYS